MRKVLCVRACVCVCNGSRYYVELCMDVHMWYVELGSTAETFLVESGAS